MQEELPDSLFSFLQNVRIGETPKSMVYTMYS